MCRDQEMMLAVAVVVAATAAPHAVIAQYQIGGICTVVQRLLLYVIIQS